MRDFRQLIVWRKSHELTLLVYSVSSEFARSHTGGLSSQMQRAALSLTTSIAEAASKDGCELVTLVRASLGWANQLEYEVLLARDLGLIEDGVHERLHNGVVEVKKMLNGLCKSVLDRAPAR